MKDQTQQIEVYTNVEWDDRASQMCCALPHTALTKGRLLDGIGR